MIRPSHSTKEETSGVKDEEDSPAIFAPVNAPDPDCRYNARLNADEPLPGPGGILLVSNAPNQWSTYAEGYKALADMGVQHALDPLEWHPLDTLVYPVVFCYRQYLELRLKELIMTAGDLLDQRLIAPTNHRLLDLWQAVRPLLQDIWSSESLEQEAEKIDNVVKQFASLDPQSMAFRYPVDTKGNRSLPGLRYVNVKRVKDAIHEIAPTLDGASTAIDEWLDTKAEMMAEYSGDMEYYSEP